MQFLMNWLGSFFAAWFTHLATRIGLQQALTIAFFVFWYALIASLTAVAYNCVGPTGVCGNAAASWNSLSQWVKFGLSLIPSEIGTMILCIISLHSAAYSAIVLNKIVKHKINAITGTSMITR